MTHGEVRPRSVPWLLVIAMAATLAAVGERSAEGTYQRQPGEFMVVSPRGATYQVEGRSGSTRIAGSYYPRTNTLKLTYYGRKQEIPLNGFYNSTGDEFVVQWPGIGEFHYQRVGRGQAFTTEAPGSGIQIVAGTYGANCGAPRGNKTYSLAQACNGRRTCVYKIDYKAIGDPARGCPKTYIAEYRCGGDPTVHRHEVPPEAGFGKTLIMTCP